MRNVTQKRYKHINLSLSESDYDRLLAAFRRHIAQAAYMSLSGYAREMMLAGLATLEAATPTPKKANKP